MLIIKIEKTIDGNIENQHLDEVCGMHLFFEIVINMWLLVYVRITAKCITANITQLSALG